VNRFNEEERVIPGMPRPRIGDVAARAGVSKTAVSFAFNQPDRLNGATRLRILDAAAELGYRPSPIARRLVARRTDQLGVVVPQPTHEIFANPFFGELLAGLGDACDEAGISLVLVPPTGGSIARSIAGTLVDGLVLVGLSPDHPELEQVRASALPAVALDVDAWAGLDVIAIDDAGGARAAGQHLRQLGHRDIAIVLMASHPHSLFAEESGISGRRLAGLREGLGLAPNAEEGEGISLRVISSTVTVDGGRAAFELLAQDGLPTAVVATSDVIAVGILLAARDAGVRVPEELSVIGYDDIPGASWTAPSLTTVHQPIREKGRLAAERLIRRIRSDGAETARTEVLPTRLVVRVSTAPPRTAPVTALPREGGAATD
jgi:DNA-binding LacI/PurR family transcriptional regulator